MLDQIIPCFFESRILYSRHARKEMEVEPLGVIKTREVFEAVSGGKLIEHYKDDEPYPSCLIFGKTRNDRPIHVVCAYDKVDDLTIVITVYEPSPDKWINFEKRRK